MSWLGLGKSKFHGWKERYGHALIQVLDELIAHKFAVENTLGQLGKEAEAEKASAIEALNQ